MNQQSRLPKSFAKLLTMTEGWLGDLYVNISTILTGLATKTLQPDKKGHYKNLAKEAAKLVAEGAHWKRVLPPVSFINLAVKARSEYLASQSQLKTDATTREKGPAEIARKVRTMQVAKFIMGKQGPEILDYYRESMIEVITDLALADDSAANFPQIPADEQVDHRKKMTVKHLPNYTSDTGMLLLMGGPDLKGWKDKKGVEHHKHLRLNNRTANEVVRNKLQLGQQLTPAMERDYDLTLAAQERWFLEPLAKVTNAQGEELLPVDYNRPWLKLDHKLAILMLNYGPLSTTAHVLKVCQMYEQSASESALCSLVTQLKDIGAYWVTAHSNLSVNKFFICAVGGHSAGAAAATALCLLVARACHCPLPLAVPHSRCVPAFFFAGA